MCSKRSEIDQKTNVKKVREGKIHLVRKDHGMKPGSTNKDIPEHEIRKLPIEQHIAKIILDVFNKHYRIFLRITKAARTRFIEADWQGEHDASMQRITLYTKRVTEACQQLQNECKLEHLDENLWQKVKFCYIGFLYEHNQPELAETFYNSVFTYLFDRRYYNNANIFVRPSISTEYLKNDIPTYYSFYPSKDGIEKSVAALLDAFDVGLPFENLKRDTRYLVKQFRKLLKSTENQDESYQLQIISTFFYRNKAAYLVGRVFNGITYLPFVIPLLNNEEGQVYVDALVVEKKDVNNLFSFARAYFMVDTEIPSAVVNFLSKMLPHKTTADIYTSIGLQKQGKTDFYRALLHHLRHSTDQFKVSSGTKGMVMSVFTLPSYPFVFKVINDRFAPPKNVTRKLVKQKYQLVKMHDRVGRLADTLEFSYVSFPVGRFSSELLDELKNNISNNLEIENDQVIIRHLYIERRLIPLNIFIRNASNKKVDKAIIEYGNAIRELAAANIFPGDLLTKNFGVTRHGRVIFYDYDEIELLLDCNFRKIPAPRHPEDLMSAEPWYAVAPLDVFPEEFLPYVFSKEDHRKVFLEHHADLLDADYWQSIQQNIRSGNYADVFPYSKSIRFKNIYHGFDSSPDKNNDASLD